jgi:hypothetical protein
MIQSGAKRVRNGLFSGSRVSVLDGSVTGKAV